jgi:hypothetical protein
VLPVVPDYLGAFVVTLNGIPKDGIGQALVAGTTAVQIDMQDEKHWCADVADEDPTMLQSCAYGGAQILYKPAGTGAKWCVVQIGPAFALPVRRVKVTAFSPGSGVLGTYTVSECGMDGTVTGPEWTEIQNVMEDSTVQGIYVSGDITTLFFGSDGVWYLDSGREVLR